MPGLGPIGYLNDVKLKEVACLAFLGLFLWACAGKSASDSADGATYGANYQGNGVQCGAIICSGSQQCCLVEISSGSSNGNPTHACDQNCESVCADTCPDSGGMTSAGAPPTGGGGMMPAGGGMMSTRDGGMMQTGGGGMMSTRDGGMMQTGGGGMMPTGGGGMMPMQGASDAMAPPAMGGGGPSANPGDL